MKTLLVDAEAGWIADKIMGMFPDCEFTGIYSKYPAFEEVFQSGCPEAAILSLDISEAGDGLGIAKQLIKSGCQVIISSKWTTFAYEALCNGAADYLLKPCMEEDIRRAISRVSERIFEREKILKAGNPGLSALDTSYNSVNCGYILLRAGESIRLIMVEKIIRIEDCNGRLTIFMENRQQINPSCSLLYLERKLIRYSFFRASSTCIVNLLKVAGFWLSKKQCTLIDGSIITLDDEMLERVQESLND